MRRVISTLEIKGNQMIDTIFRRHPLLTLLLSLILPFLLTSVFAVIHVHVQRIPYSIGRFLHPAIIILCLFPVAISLFYLLGKLKSYAIRLSIASLVTCLWGILAYFLTIFTYIYAFLLVGGQP